MTKIHAEIEYFEDKKYIHSDICLNGCNFTGITQEYRQYLHSLLDEWLDCSNGTGGFYIKNENHHFNDIEND